MGERDPASAMILAAISPTVVSSGFPMLTGPARSLAASSSSPRTVSSAWHSDRVCVPSPVTVTGSPRSAWQANVGTIRPSSGRMPGP
jgi:hypothetical protein